VETSHVADACPPGGTTPGVVARHVAPSSDLTRSEAHDASSPRERGSRPDAPRATHPASGQEAATPVESPTTEGEELPPPPEWYLNTPLVRKEEWADEGVDHYWDEGEEPILDDEIDYTQIEEYDPRDDPDMERVA
jgi:hypothetical protein